MASEKIGQIVKAHCSRCGGERNCDIAGHHAEGDDNDHHWWRRDWYLLVCRGCENIFAQSVSTDSESVDYGYDADGGEAIEYVETIETWPPRSRRERPDWFSHELIRANLSLVPLSDALRELYGALDNNLNVLAGIGLRTVFDVAAERLQVEPTLTFAQKLDRLADVGLVSEDDKEHLTVLVEAGSASAHRGWKPSGPELDALVEILENFIRKAFVEPKRAKETAEKIAKIKSTVPKRSSKAKALAT